MKEKKRTASIPVGKGHRITVLSGTKQVFEHLPDSKNDVIVDITVTEILPEN